MRSCHPGPCREERGPKGPPDRSGGTRFGGGRRQPPCPASPTAAPPHLPLELGWLLATAGQAVVTGPGHRAAGTASAVGQSPPLEGQGAGQGRRGDPRIHECAGTKAGHRRGRGHVCGDLGSLFPPTLLTGEETGAHGGGATCPRSVTPLDFRAVPGILSRCPRSAETARKGPRRAGHHAGRLLSWRPSCLRSRAAGPRSGPPALRIAQWFHSEAAQDPHLASLSQPPARPPDLCICAQSRPSTGTGRGRWGGLPETQTGSAPDVAGALHSPKAGTFDLCNTTARGLPGADCTLGLLGGWFWAAGRLTGWGLSPPALTALLAACMHSRARGPLPGLRCCCPHQAPLQTASGPSSATPPCTSASCLSPGLAWAAGAIWGWPGPQVAFPGLHTSLGSSG